MYPKPIEVLNTEHTPDAETRMCLHRGHPEFEFLPLGYKVTPQYPADRRRDRSGAPTLPSLGISILVSDLIHEPARERDSIDHPRT